jgi:hypothetical protein
VCNLNVAACFFSGSYNDPCLFRYAWAC